MTEQAPTTPVTDTVPKVGDELAVGENLRFQQRWWTFERIIWPVFLLLIIADGLGAFGHGWLSRASKSVPDGALSMDYERIERANTPSVMILHFGPGAIRDGRIQLYVSNPVLEKLGAQRLLPQPAASAIGGGGVSYTYPATISPADVQIQLQPAAPGIVRFRIAIPGHAPMDARVLVLP